MLMRLYFLHGSYIRVFCGRGWVWFSFLYREADQRWLTVYFVDSLFDEGRSTGLTSIARLA